MAQVDEEGRESPRSSSAESAPASGRPFRLPWWLPGRIFAAALLIGAAALIAFRQEPNPDDWANPSITSLDWWRYPVEYNAFARRAATDADINAIFVVPDTGALWIVGNGGFVARSDAGRTWKRVELRGKAANESAPASTSERRSSTLLPSLVASAHAAMKGDDTTNAPRSASKESKAAPDSGDSLPQRGSTSRCWHPDSL